MGPGFLPLLEASTKTNFISSCSEFQVSPEDSALKCAISFWETRNHKRQACEEAEEPQQCCEWTKIGALMRQCALAFCHGWWNIQFWSCHHLIIFGMLVHCLAWVNKFVIQQCPLGWKRSQKCSWCLTWLRHFVWILEPSNYHFWFNPTVSGTQTSASGDWWATKAQTWGLLHVHVLP